uniref:Putative secreted protein n=1 Tax=Anopheles triannulatus TaxID=58253 RepID=A0A2M4B6D1_9DIPT
MLLWIRQCMLLHPIASKNPTHERGATLSSAARCLSIANRMHLPFVDRKRCASVVVSYPYPFPTRPGCCCVFSKFGFDHFKRCVCSVEEGKKWQKMMIASDRALRVS